MNPFIAYRLYKFNRRCGLPRWHAIKKAVKTALQPQTNPNSKEKP